DLNLPLVRVDDAFDRIWANLVDKGGQVRARARYAGDNSELGYTTTGVAGYQKLLGVVANRRVLVDDASLPAVYGTDVQTFGKTGWVSVPEPAGVPFRLVLNDLTQKTFLSSLPGDPGFANSFDQMVTWQVQGSKDLHYVIAWEDRVIKSVTVDDKGGIKCDGANCDFNDYVFELKLIKPIPEPSTWALMGLGLVGAAFAVRRTPSAKRVG
nr:PEP-CTERM sorting domain-containing protein [Burkholderiales bacterium]